MLSFAMMRPSLKDHLLDLVFPSLCAGCGAHCPAPLCGSCALSLSRRAVRGESDLSTPGHTVAFGGFRAAGDYRGALKDMVLRLKDSERRLAAPLAALMLAAAGNEPGYLFPSAITYVPSTREKLARRGYNQSRLLAVEFSRLTGVPVIDALRVAAKTADQDSVPGRSRWSNVAGAFAASREAPSGVVLLLDDVMTTGATADACSRALIEAGASSVQVLVAARAVLRRGIGKSDQTKITR